MRIPKNAGLVAILTGLVVSGAASAGETPAGDQGPASASERTCAVKVDRTQAAGTYDVTRQMLGNGACICYVYTGPSPQSDPIERAISALKESRDCPNAKVMIVPPAGVAVSSGSPDSP